MWKLLKDLYITCLFLIGYMPKKKALPSSSSTNKSITYGEVVTLDTKPMWLYGMQKELLAAKADAEKPIISEAALEKLINNFFTKVLPEEYKKYLKDPIGNIGGKWIIITHYAFNSDTRIVRLALPIIAERLKPFNIRAEDRGQNGYMWISATDITASLEPIEQADKKWLKNKTPSIIHVKKVEKLLFR
jgi:hypothetical protein